MAMSLPSEQQTQDVQRPAALRRVHHLHPGMMAMKATIAVSFVFVAMMVFGIL